MSGLKSNFKLDSHTDDLFELTTLSLLSFQCQSHYQTNPNYYYLKKKSYLKGQCHLF